MRRVIFDTLVPCPVLSLQRRDKIKKADCISRGVGHSSLICSDVKYTQQLSGKIQFSCDGFHDVHSNNYFLSSYSSKW
ncbi:MAG: hypothetical protein ACXVBX_16545 [Flavisolibacter sp.]